MRSSRMKQNYKLSNMLCIRLIKMCDGYYSTSQIMEWKIIELKIQSQY